MHESTDGTIPLFLTYCSLSLALCFVKILCTQECKPQLNLDLRIKKKVCCLWYCLHTFLFVFPQIAEHVDSTDGFLTKLSLYKALALIALAQQGKQPSPKLFESFIQGKWVTLLERQESNKGFCLMSSLLSKDDLRNVVCSCVR